MNDVRELEEEVYRTKKKAKWGCLAWVAIFFFFLFIFVGVFSLEMYLKEKILVISNSPNEISCSLIFLQQNMVNL